MVSSVAAQRVPPNGVHCSTSNSLALRDKARDDRTLGSARKKGGSMRVSILSQHFHESAPLCLLALLSLFGQVHAASGAATEIVSASSGQCMQVSGASQSSGAAVIQSP